MTKIRNCSICGQEKVDEWIDLGEQVVCHHYLKSRREEVYRHNLGLGQCRACATVQLTDRIPIQELKPRYDWIRCNEPEDHLDRLVQRISQLPGITKDSKVYGISFKEDSTLERLNKLGFQNTWRPDPGRDLGVTDAIVGFQAVGEHFNPESARRLVKTHGKADVLIARQIMEHAYDLRGFIEASKQLISPDGYLVFEVPDCGQALDTCDYVTVWEEHTIYFTEKTFRDCFGFLGLSVVHFEKFPYLIENCFVAITKPDPSVHVPAPREDDLSGEFSRFKKYADGYGHQKNRIKKFLAGHKQRNEKVIIFGAGHVGCAVLNFFELKDQIEFVVDDDPHMRGLFMPGSGLPILGSKAIYEKDVKLCILTMKTPSDEKVVKNNQRFFEKGGAFVSIFPESRWAIKF